MNYSIFRSEIQHTSTDDSVVQKTSQQTIDFDQETGKFIVTLQLTAEEYGRCALHQMIAKVGRIKFNEDSGIFRVPVYMSPEQYVQYSKDKVLPFR